MKHIIKIFFILFFTPTVCAELKTININGHKINISNIRHSSPSLNFKTHDNKIYYGILTTDEISNTIHILKDNIKYNLKNILHDTKNYTYDSNGYITSANENIYLESTGKQYIDTGIIPVAGTGAEIKTRITRSSATGGLDEDYEITHSGTQTIAGTTGLCENGKFTRSPEMYFGLFTHTYTDYAAYYFNSYHMTNMQLTFNDLIHASLHVNTSNTSATSVINNLTQGTSTTNTTEGYISTNGTISLFGIKDQIACNAQEFAIAKIYYFKIFQNGILIHHYVPVPAGMQIGNFYTPTNGMWDIISKQFYGNQGTGYLSYGIEN